MSTPGVLSGARIREMGWDSVFQYRIAVRVSVESLFAPLCLIQDLFVRVCAWWRGDK